MECKINKNAIYQYILIYFMLILNQSMIDRLFLKPYYSIIFVVLVTIILIRIRKLHLQNFSFLFFLLISVAFVRMISNNGIGLESWISWSVPILSVYLAIMYDKQNFLCRFVKVVFFLAFISLVGYIITLIYPDLLKKILISYDSGRKWIEWDMGKEYTYYFKAYGILLYSFIDHGMLMRNLGIYTEPGIHQMVLNTALFILIFKKEQLSLSNKQVEKYIFIILITIITCQSTTGYIAMFAILSIAIIVRNGTNKNVKRNILFIAILIIAIIITDYIINRQNSIVYSVLINKLFGSDGAFSLSATSSGQARVGTISVTLESMIANPLGIGTVETSRLLDYENTKNVAAAIMTIGSSLGVIPFTIILSWMFIPVLKSKDSLLIKLLLIFLYFNTALAQSSAFYPTLILIPMWMSIVNYKSYYVKIA